MSSEWVLQKLSTLGTFDRGKSKHRPRDAAHLYGGPYPFIQTGDVTASGGRITTYRQTYSEAGLAQSRLWPVNTLCITIAANIAETGLLTFPACFPDSVVGFTADPKKANIRFIEYIFQAFRASVKSKAYGSVQENINLEVLRNLEFPIPSLNNQKKIADFFTLIDDRIALLRETNATLEAIAQALFKSWFVDFDPVHANAAFLENVQAPSLPAEIQALFPSRLVESPQGLIPEGWEWGAISYFAALNPESWTAKKHPNTVAYIDLANAKDNVIADIAEFEFADAPSRARRVLKDGDTIVGTVRPGNRSFAFIYDAASNLTGSTGFAVLRPKHPRNTAFVYLAATNDNSIDHLTHVADGGAYPAVRPDVVAGLTWVCPPENVLDAFNEVASELLFKISKNHSQAQTLANLRDTLLPRLISGQLRLPEAEAALAAVG